MFATVGQMKVVAFSFLLLWPLTGMCLHWLTLRRDMERSASLPSIGAKSSANTHNCSFYSGECEKNDATLSELCSRTVEVCTDSHPDVESDNTFCYSLFKTNEAGNVTFLKKGCWTHPEEDCRDKVCGHYIHATGFRYCCCTGDMCNVNVVPLRQPSTERSEESSARTTVSRSTTRGPLRLLTESNRPTKQTTVSTSTSSSRRRYEQLDETI